MLFTASIFWLLVAAVIGLTLLNQVTRRSAQAQNMLFVLASVAFYAGWDWRFLGLILFSTMLDYLAALAIDASRTPGNRRFFLSLSLIGNLGLLGVFKYLGFFVEQATSALTFLGLTAHPTTLNIILPVGISFYTLQTLSYTIDVYRGVSKPETNLLRYATYVTFFPQLLAGPIERARTLLNQFSRFNPITWSGVYQGLCLILVGLFLKVCIADNLAPVVDAIYATHDSRNGGVLALGAIYFTVQIYGDFAGYSTIALGVASALGVRLSTNFRTPFLSTSFADFWQRWHVSLFSFLRDYVYRALGGGNRRYTNVILLFLASGIWHGANWTFFVWGLGNGIVLAFLEWLHRNRRRRKQEHVLRKLWGWITTFSLFVIGCIFFRSPDLATATTYLGAILTDPSMPDAYRSAFKYVLLCFAIDLMWRRDVRLTRGLIPQLSGLRIHRSVEALLMVTLLISILVTGIAHVDHTAFIYFQF